MYNNLDALPRPDTSVDRSLSDTAWSYLINFGTGGDPNEGSQRGLPTWPTFGDPSQVIFLGDTVNSGPVPNRAALDCFTAFYNQARGRPLAF